MGLDIISASSWDSKRDYAYLAGRALRFGDVAVTLTKRLGKGQLVNLDPADYPAAYQCFLAKVKKSKTVWWGGATDPLYFHSGYQVRKGQRYVAMRKELPVILFRGVFS